MFSVTPLAVSVALCMSAMMGFNAVAGPLIRALGLADWHAGAVVSVAGLLWMLSARAWGGASDRLGRKPVLLAGVGGFAGGYMLLALFVLMALPSPPPVLLSLCLLVVARGLLGLFYAAVPPVSGALVADNIPPQARASYMARLGAAAGIGMVAGPFIASLLAGRGLAMPLYAFAALPLVALFLLWRFLPAGPPVQAGGPRRAVRLADPRLRLPVVAAYVSMFTINAAQICVGFLMIDRLDLSPEDGARMAGYALGGIGICLIAVQMGVAAAKQVAPLTWIRGGVAIAVAAALGVALAGTAPLLIGAFCLLAVGLGTVVPSFQALAANSVGPDEQGSAAGTVAAAQGLAMVTGPLIATGLYGLAPAAPFLLAAVGLALLLAFSLNSSKSPSGAEEVSP